MKKNEHEVRAQKIWKQNKVEQHTKPLRAGNAKATKNRKRYMSAPTYNAIVAVTIDGKIAKDKHHMSDWTSKEDKEFMRAELKKSDVIVIGNNTYKTATGPLSKRNCIVFTRSVENTKQEHENLLYCNPANTSIEKLIKEKGYKTIAILGGAATYSYFLEKNLIDNLYLTIEPLIFGDGIGLFNAPHKARMKFITMKQLNLEGAVLLHYTKS
jgi:dihydrofolate reductase